MARGSSQATTAATNAQNISTGAGANANALYGTLAPELESQAANPQGYAPADIAAMTTSAEQGAGGSQAAAVGQGALLAGRTRNAGTADAAIDSASRNASKQLGNETLGIQTGNADLKAKQQHEAMQGEQSLYGTELSGELGALGQIPGDVNANTNAANESYGWAKYLLDPLLSSGAGSDKFSI